MQTTSCILMVRPSDFAFNEETARDNEFQHAIADRDIRAAALAEFDAATRLLQNEGVRVLILEKTPGLPPLPDAVFPNNWLATDSRGTLHLFPMKTPNRRAETGQLPTVKALLSASGIAVTGVTDWQEMLGPEAVLEGTGSLIFDHPGRVVYAAISERTQARAVEIFAQNRGLKPLLFHTESRMGKPYYHTNVVMSIGENLAVVCLECIPDAREREAVRTQLAQNHALLEISRQQLEEGFCGNLLQVRNPAGQAIWVLSSTAWNALLPDQKSRLEASGKCLAIPIPTLETVGGGSIRCMMAEIFSPGPK